jgi:hypothetical protein
MPDSTIIVDVEHNYSLRVPNTTPTGQPVEILKREHEGMHAVHALSPDESEVYFEIVSFSVLISHEEAVAGQRASLASRSPAAAITAMQRSVVRTWRASEFRFEGALGGRWKVRRFLFLDSAMRTFRIIYDPRSTMNEQILESLVLKTERGA